ncbi:MAG: hypothetical protein RLP09_08530, partial [Sandaracinaceae bacterium]
EREGGPIAMDDEVVEAMGFEAVAHGTVGPVTSDARLEADRAGAVRLGDRIALDVAAEAVHHFDAESQRALR